MKDKGDQLTRKRPRGNLPICRGTSHLKAPGGEEEPKRERERAAVLGHLDQAKENWK